jgi:hypothetical protein
MNDLKQIQDFFSKPLKENTTDWPKEVPSRHGDIIFRLVKVMPDRAKYELIDAETGKTWEVGGRVYGTVNQLKASAEDTIKPQGGRQSSQFESVNEELNLSNYGKVTPPKGGASLVGKYNSIQGKSKYAVVVFDYQEGSDKPYGIVQVQGYGIYGSDLLKRLGLRQTRSWTAGVDVYTHDGNYTPVYVSEDDFKALLDFWSGGLDREAKAQADFYRNRGNTSGTIDEAKVDYDFSERELIRVLRQLKRGASTEVDMIKAFTKALGRDLTKDELFSESIAKINEATEEDKIDIVTMDVPLFIRILEYSREDAQEDMDLHDLTEKAITATKQQGILSMDDYDMLVGDSESLNEQSLDDQAKAYFLAKVKRGEIDTLPEDPKAAFLAQMMKDQMGHDKETLRRERGLEERISKALNELNEELCAKGKRYIKARKRAGEKSSAYLSGRAVKVCKGQIEWPKQGKKKVNESEIDALAKELANAVEDKLEDKKDEINEALDPISILSYVLAGNTLVNIIAKYVGKLFKKYNFGKGEEAAKKIYDFTHKLEQDFKKPIGRVVGLFTKDEKTKNTVTDGLFALLLLGLGAKAGTEAFSAIKKSNFIAGGISGIKAALKGKDITTLVQDIVSNV